MATITDLTRDTVQFLLPRTCARCVAALSARARTVQLAIQRHTYGRPVVAVTDYDERARRIVTSFKDKGMHSLAGPLATLMAHAWSAQGATDLQPVLIVPVPSAPGGMIRRGYEPTRLLASELSARVAASRSTRALTRRGRWVGGQRKTMRRRRRLMATPTYRSHFDLSGYSVLIVDDVVTTGASLESAASALTESGAQVVGAVVFASAMRGSAPPCEPENSGDTALATGLRLKPSQADS